MKSKTKNSLLFISIVLIPWLLISAYVLFFAHPRYVSSTELIVKQVGDANVSPQGGLSALLGVSSVSKDDANYLTAYILSLDIIKQLDKHFKFREAYHLDGSDPIYEIKPDASQEELLDYYRDRVHVSLNEQTYVLTITTEGFNPDYALKLNKAILALSENFVNDISQNVAKEQLITAEDQLEQATQRLNNAKQQLLDYQNSNQIFDPQANAQALGNLISTLEANLSALKTEERTLLSYLNDTAPQVVAVRSQINAVEQQIEQERRKLTSPDDSKLNQQAVQFETIKSDVDFSADLYKLALTALEKSRLEAFRKLKNVIVITSPYQAEEATYPRHWYIITTAFILLMMLYGFVRLVISVIEDHKD